MSAPYSDIPLKPPQETFSDDPESLEDVSLDELSFDLSHKIKSIGKLHLYHSICVLQHTLELIIRLHSDPESYAQFRSNQLSKYGLHEGKQSYSIDTENDSNCTDEPRYVSIKQLVAQTNVTDEEPSSSLWIERLKHSLRPPSSNKETNFKSFNLIKPPGLSIADFLLRIKTYSSAMPPSSYVHAAFMLFRICVLEDAIILTEYNVHRFILASLRCSTKILEDLYQKQARFSNVVGVSMRELFRLEVSFLFACNFKLAVDENILDLFLSGFFVDLVQYCKNMEN